VDRGLAPAGSLAAWARVRDRRRVRPSPGRSVLETGSSFGRW